MADGSECSFGDQGVEPTGTTLYQADKAAFRPESEDVFIIGFTG